MPTKMYFTNEKKTNEWSMKNVKADVRLFNFQHLKRGGFTIKARSKEQCKILEGIGATQSGSGSKNIDNRKYDKFCYHATANQLIEFRKKLIGTDPYKRLEGRSGSDYVVAMEESVINFIPLD